MRVIITLACLAVLLVSIIYGFWASAAAGRYVRPGVIVVMPVINEPRHMFTPTDIENAAIDFEGFIALGNVSSMPVVGNETASAHVNRAGRDYFNMVFMHFTNGGPWHNDNAHTAVICESLAWALFGSIDVLGLTVRIGGELYVVSGIVQSSDAGVADGFAWVPRGSAACGGNALYLRPDVYNPITAYLSAADMLTNMNRRAQDFTITDVNAFVDSIALRMRVLLGLTGLMVIFIAAKLTYRMIRGSETTIDWVVSGVAVLVCIGVTVFMLPHVTMDLWVPAFAGDGALGYARLFFNVGLLAPRQYLPGNLTMLYDFNLRANVAFVTGLLGLFGCVLFCIKHENA